MMRRHPRSTRTDTLCPYTPCFRSKPTAGFERLWAGPMGLNLGRLATLVRIATGAADEAAARLAVVTLYGQVIVIRAARATCGRLLGGPLDDPDFIPSFKARIAANTDAVLDRLISEQGQS